MNIKGRNCPLSMGQSIDFSSMEINVDAPSTSTPKSRHVNAMIDRINSHPDAVLLFCKEGESLDAAARSCRLREIFNNSAASFLSRYYRFIDVTDLRCFEHIPVDEGSDLSAYFKFVAANQNRPSFATIRNRRYAKVKELVRDGAYFSDIEMRHREPLLYERMIGQFQSQGDITRHLYGGDRSNATLSDIFLEIFDDKQDSKRHNVDNELPKSNKCKPQNPEPDSDESELESDCEDEPEAPNPPQISAEDKQRFRDEFLQLMKDRFMNGLDTTFDYSTVDNCEAYDSLEQIRQDAEDEYFDSEQPSVSLPCMEGLDVSDQS